MISRECILTRPFAPYPHLVSLQEGGEMVHTIQEAAYFTMYFSQDNVKESLWYGVDEIGHWQFATFFSYT